MDDNVREMRLKADDITCTSCAEDMEKILMEKDGVLDVSVSYKDDTVVIKYDSDIIGRKDVYFAVRKVGYKVNIVSET